MKRYFFVAPRERKARAMVPAIPDSFILLLDGPKPDEQISGINYSDP